MTAVQFTGDFRTVGVVGGGQPEVAEFDVVLGVLTSIEDGDLVIVDGSNAGYVKKAADAASNTARWIGRARKDSTDTVAAAGTVEVEYHPNGLIVRGNATTVGSFAQSIIDTRVTLDVAAGVQTVDENDTTNGALTIIRYATVQASDIDVIVPFNSPYVS